MFGRSICPCLISVSFESVRLHKEYRNLLGNIPSFINTCGKQIVAALTLSLCLKVLSGRLTNGFYIYHAVQISLKLIKRIVKILTNIWFTKT